MTTTIRSNGDGSKSYIAVGGTDVVTIGTQGIEAGSFKPGTIVAADFADGALIENSVNGIGYGTGAGGTVTQATSKSTAVTLNKPCGQITMHNEALAASASVYFSLNNSLIEATDHVVVCPAGFSHYRVEVRIVENGSVSIRVTNLYSISKSDALLLNFAVIKGATS